MICPGPAVLGTTPCPGTQIMQTNRGGVSVPTENCNLNLWLCSGCPSFTGYTRAGLSNTLKTYCSKWENVPFTLDLNSTQRNERSHSKDQDVGKHSRKRWASAVESREAFLTKRASAFCKSQLGRCWWRVRVVGERRRDLQGRQRDGAAVQDAAALGFGV